MSSEMTEARFWEIVESVNWASKPDADKAKRALMGGALGTPGDAVEFNKRFEAVAGELNEVMNAYEDEQRFYTGYQFPLGGDGWGDMVAHIVGLGREVYERELRNVELLKKRAQRYEYVESFAYCIPSPGDYEKLSFGYYQKRAADYVGEMAEMANSWRVDLDAPDGSAEVAKSARALLNSVATQVVTSSRELGALRESHNGAVASHVRKWTGLECERSDELALLHLADALTAAALNDREHFELVIGEAVEAERYLRQDRARNYPICWGVENLASDFRVFCR